jgi:Putative auto-transporter adhesin, head GIN domain
MKKLIPVLLLIVVVLAACEFLGKRVKGNGHSVTENRTVRDASRIHVLGSYDVQLSPGTVGVKVEADENLQPYIITQNEGDQLIVKTRDGVNLHSSNPIKIYISTDKLEEISISGAGSVNGTDKFVGGDRLMISLSGVGNLNLLVNTPKIVGHISGAGSMTVSGETRDAEVQVSGVGSFKGNNLKAENVKIQLSGTGNANVYASSTLDVSISGIGSVNYSGNPTIQQHISGMGSVKKVD